MTHASRPSHPVEHVAAVVVTTNERHWLRECLDSLLDSRLRPDRRLSVVVVDNASTDGGPEFVKAAFPDVEVLPAGRNAGYAGASNIGIARAMAEGADCVLLLNPDTRTPPDLVQGIADFLSAWPEYGIVGPLQYRYTDDGTPSSTLNEWSVEALRWGEAHVFAADRVPHASTASPTEGRAPRTLEHAYVQGSALACRSSMLSRVGVFDPTYHTYYEETDLCRRARWAGWRVALLLDLGVQHKGGGGTRHSLYRRRRMLRNKYYFLATDPDWRWRESMRLALRWLSSDLRGRGPAPAPTRCGALVDTTAGLVWLSAHTARMVRMRRTHARLRDRVTIGHTS